MQRKLPNICKKKTAPTWRHKLHYIDDNITFTHSFTNYTTNQSGSWACHMLLLLCLCSVPDLNHKFDITIAPTMSSVCHYPDDRWTDSGGEVGGGQSDDVQWKASPIQSYTWTEVNMTHTHPTTARFCTISWTVTPRSHFCMSLWHPIIKSSR